jgi:hypothetical protein
MFIRLQIKVTANLSQYNLIKRQSKFVRRTAAWLSGANFMAERNSKEILMDSQ